MTTLLGQKRGPSHDVALFNYFLKESKRKKDKSSDLWNVNSIKGLHEVKYSTSVSFTIKQLFNWRGFLVALTNDNLIIYENAKKVCAVSFGTLDNPIISHACNTIYLVCHTFLKTITVKISSSQTIPPNSELIPSESNGSTGIVQTDVGQLLIKNPYYQGSDLGCTWNNHLVFAKHNHNTLNILPLDDLHSPVQEFDVGSITYLLLSAKSSLWVVFWDHVVVFRTLEELKNGKGVNVIFSTVALCYWNAYDCVASAAYKSIRIRNNQNGKLIKSFEGHVSDITCLCGSGELLYSGSIDGEIRVWNWSGNCMDALWCTRLSSQPATINTMCDYRGNVWASVDSGIVCLSHRPWKIQRVLWIGNYKNDAKDCMLAILPRELLKFIISLL